MGVVKKRVLNIWRFDLCSRSLAHATHYCMLWNAGIFPRCRTPDIACYYWRMEQEGRTRTERGGGTSTPTGHWPHWPIPIQHFRWLGAVGPMELFKMLMHLTLKPA
jgi:hypothetical protein